ncbi:MAG: ATP-binding cassette domain-containing protein, partial [Lachnospiraceae bacterium]|nr:ATP-binding cassette domain-containing protein [Lachnospiraceae bacterium]
MGNAIEVSNLCKEYQGFALKNISFSVPEGLCCGFVGPNGAGKTTVLKAMTGMILKSSGEICLLGRPNDDVKVKEEIGIVFDQPYFQESWT